MLNPLQTLNGVRYDDLQRMITTIVSQTPTNQIFAESTPKGYGKSATCDIKFTVFFDGPIKAEPIVKKALLQFLNEQQYMRTYTFSVEAEARPPIIKPKGKRPLGFQDRIWDRNAIVTLMEPEEERAFRKKKMEEERKAREERKKNRNKQNRRNGKGGKGRRRNKPFKGKKN